MTDLQAEDFQVFQNGVKKQISNFKLYTDEVIQQQFVPQPGLANPLAAPTPVPVAGEGGGPRPVHFVIYIDNQNLEPLDRNRVLSQAREFISSSLHPPAQMMVVAYQRSFEVLQTFTSDPNEVVEGYLVLLEPSETSGVAAWELAVGIDCAAQWMTWDIEGQQGEKHLLVNERTLPMLTGWKSQSDYLMNEDVDAIRKFLVERGRRG